MNRLINKAFVASLCLGLGAMFTPAYCEAASKVVKKQAKAKVENVKSNDFYQNAAAKSLERSKQYPKAIAFKGKSAATAEEQRYLNLLWASMPLADLTAHDADYYLDNVRIALRTRTENEWGKSIPDDVFRHFVLPLRINNENLDDFRTTYYDEIHNRIKGLSLHDAALEVNHWCHEKVVYEPSDSRTSSPMATIVTAKGRCGEESTLAVAAMRTAGIPARQVYTPRWAHTDDNHAWVEVWVDGKWYFLGACEPEPVLNRAWFNAPASRGMLMHTKVLGDYSGAEPIISKQNGITEINVVENYVPTRINTISVVDRNGKPASGVTVEFKIYNYAEFYTAARAKSDSNGKASLKTGLGDMLVWATDGTYFGFAKASSENTTLKLDHKVGEAFSLDIDIVPPAEGNIPSDATQAQIDDNNARMAREDSIRGAYTATFPSSQSTANMNSRTAAIMLKSRGNHKNIEKFLDEVPAQRQGEALGMLEAISDKDLRDTPCSVLFDNLVNTTPDLNNPLYTEYVLNPRISNELLTPFKKQLKSDSHRSAKEIAQYVSTNIKVDDAANPMRVPMSPYAVHTNKVSDSHSRDIYFVALCRTEGQPARIDPVTGKTQYNDGKRWIDVDFVKAETVERPKGVLKADYKPSESMAKVVPNPQYYRHFSLSEIRNGSPFLLEFDEEEDYFDNTFGKGYSLDEGYYLLVSGSRMANGSVLAHMEFIPVKAGETKTTELVMRESKGEVAVLGNMDPEKLYLPRNSKDKASILSTTGRGYFILASLGVNDEPTNHAVVDFEAITNVLNDWGRPVLVLCEANKDKLSGIKNLHYGTDPDGSVTEMLRKGTNSSRTDLPVITICDSFGRIVFISEGYNTSLGEQLKAVIHKL